jgi:hypothetical protein
MSQNGSILNRGQGEAQASEEPNPWLLKRLIDRALPFAAQQQPNHLGESSSRLARWVIASAGVASTLSRAIHLPLLSRAFDSILRKPAFIPPVWQKMLDLPWFRRGGHYPDTTVQTFGEAEEEQLIDETDETYSLFTADMLSPPITGKGLLTTINRLPHDAPTRTLPAQTKEIAGTRYSNEPNQGLRISKKEQPVHPAGEAYPLVIKNLFSPPATTSKSLIARQAAVAHETQDTNTLASSYASQSKISISDIYKSSERQMSEHRHIEDAQDSQAQVKQQTQHINVGQPISGGLAPVIQRATQQRGPMEARSQSANDSISKGHASISRDFLHPKAIDRAGESGSMIAKPATLPSQVRMPEDVSEVPHQAAISGIESKPDGMALDWWTPPKVTSDEVSRVLPRRVPQHRIALQRAPDISQIRTGEPVISRQTQHVRQEAKVTRVPEEVANLSPDKSTLVTPEHSSIDRDSTKAYAEKPLFYRQPLPILSSTIEPPIVKSISRTVTSPSAQLFKSVPYVPISGRSENYRFLGSDENEPSLPGYKDASQPALELQVASSVRPKAEFSAPRREGMFRQTSDTIHDLTYSRNNDMPEVALTPIARAAEANEPPPATIPESRGGESGEQGSAPDIKALAREIYPLLKQMIMVERERRPTW